VTAKLRTVLWAKEEPLGIEFAEVRLTSSTLRAVGVAIGSAPVAYRLDYLLETRPGFVTSRLRATTRGDGWRRRLDLHRTASGTWSAATQQNGDTSLPPPGGDVALLAEARDCDLGFSPLTNSLPVLRSALLRGGGPVNFSIAWVSVPDLGVHPDGQRYIFLRTEANQYVIRYEAVDGTFTADITFDRDGVVLDYPGIARRLP